MLKKQDIKLMEKKDIINYLEEGLRLGLSYLYFWLTNDGEALGYILGIIHVMLVVTLALAGIYCHTIFPALWFKVFVFAWMFVTCLQHVFLRVCIFTLAEEKFTNMVPPSNIFIFYIIKKVLNINVPDILTTFVLCETIVVSCFALELISYVAVYIYSICGIEF
jgi:hypothetical protein